MALEMRAVCERCQTALEATGEAYVCSFECSFCPRCQAELGGACPHCGGELLRRPRRGVPAGTALPRRPEEPSATDHASGGLAPTFAAPYAFVAFTSKRTDVDGGYGATAARMAELAAQQPGFLGLESVRAADGLGVTLAYWRTLDELRAWKTVDEHRRAQERGRSEWYRAYRVRVGLVQYDYGFDSPPGAAGARA